MSGPDYSPLPLHLQAGMRRWVEDGGLPGGFLSKVLAADLHAVLSADQESLGSIVSIVQWCCSELPSQCWGSLEKMRGWKAARGENGIQSLIDEQI